MSERYWLFVHLFQLLDSLFDSDNRAFIFRECLIRAADDPEISISEYVKLMHFADQLLGRV